MPRQSKSKSQRLHARRRIVERYGLELSRAEWRDIIQAIQSNRAVHVERQSNRVSVFDVPIRDKMVRVVYDKVRKSIATALPRASDDCGGH